MKVSQLVNNNGNGSMNQFILKSEHITVFQSYNTTIAKIENGVITLDSNALNYSKTTSKHLFIFLGMNRKEIESSIKSGVIKQQDLN